MQHPNPADHPNHILHDATLVAGHAAGDLADSERARAQAIIDSCLSCADLHRDLIAIATATRALPSLATAPRDFRLDAEQAARLSRGSWLRAALRPFGAARSATRPMAAALTSLGIAGLFVVTIMPGLFGSAASTGAQRENTPAGAPMSTDGPAVAPGGSVTSLGGDASSAPIFAAGSPRADEVDPNDMSVDPPATDGSKAEGAGGVSPPTDLGSGDEARDNVATQANPVLIGSLGLLAMGILLFGLQFAARRIR
jgi:hypothetical protein